MDKSDMQRSVESLRHQLNIQRIPISQSANDFKQLTQGFSDAKGSSDLCRQAKTSDTVSFKLFQENDIIWGWEAVSTLDFKTMRSTGAEKIRMKVMTNLTSKKKSLGVGSHRSSSLPVDWELPPTSKFVTSGTYLMISVIERGE
uniref:Uncharacterized protein n=1 Tax=Parascaris equorum TaxID=6256 RepID=A0A914S9E9_PAREQ